MPLDSNIAMSFNPGPAPDVGNKMQTSAQNMTNVIALQRQRDADALAQQQREQAAVTQALAPAVAAVFSDPSDAGLDAALNMVPQQYRGAMQAQVEQLKAITDPNRRKDVVRAALLQDNVGQALLAQLEPTANARLNADMAAQRAALDARRLQLEENKLAQGDQMTPYQKAQIELERTKLENEKSKGTAEEVKQRLAAEKRDKEIAFAVKEVETAAADSGLLDEATGSYFGNLIDTAAQSVGYGTPGAVANAKMKPIADLVLKLVPRFEGPQSDKDTQSYKDAAGDLANPNLPASVKKAAAKQIVTLLKKYSGNFEYAPDAETEPSAEAPPVLPDGATTSNW